MEKYIKGQKIQHKNHDADVYVLVTQSEPARGNLFKGKNLLFNDVELLASQVGEYSVYSEPSKSNSKKDK